MSKIIVITGAGEGLGKALSRRFCADGDKVVLLGRTLSKLETAAADFGPNAMAVRCDIADPASVREAFATIAETYDRIDVLINNAAVYSPLELQDADDAEVLAQATTNVAGPVFVAREALPLMGEGSHIVNLTSETVEMELPMLWLYAATKAAVERIAQGWRKELGPRGIRVTTVRASKMFGEGKTGSGWSQDATIRFATACAKEGIPMQEQPLTDFSSLPDLFRLIVDSPADLNLDLVTLAARRAG